MKKKQVLAVSSALMIGTTTALSFAIIHQLTVLMYLRMKN